MKTFYQTPSYRSWRQSLRELHKREKRAKRIELLWQIFSGIILAIVGFIFTVIFLSL